MTQPRLMTAVLIALHAWCDDEPPTGDKARHGSCREKRTSACCTGFDAERPATDAMRKGPGIIQLSNRTGGADARCRAK